jgi:membrane fusion protein (multidrug efflux system)
MNRAKLLRPSLWGPVSALALLLLTACGGSDSGGGHAQAGPGAARSGDRAGRPERPPVPVAVEGVTTGPISSYYAATATLEAESRAEILARVAGVVRTLRCEEGDVVRTGQPLLQIEDAEFRYRLQQAEARTANLRSRFDRLQGMVEKNLVSVEEFDLAKSELAAAEAEEGLARLELGYATVQAPFAGVVTQRLVDTGQNVSVGSPLFQLADFDPLLARVHVPAKEFGRLRTEQSVQLTLDSDGRELTGRITLISPIIDPNSGTIKVTIEIPEHPQDVRPGDFAQVSIVTERRENRTLVPRVAVVTDKGEDVVFVAREGIAERRVVELGLSDDRHSEVLSGVEPGEQVVVRGQRSLQQGAPIRVLDREIPAREESTREEA